MATGINFEVIEGSITTVCSTLLTRITTAGNTHFRIYGGLTWNGSTYAILVSYKQ